MTKNSACTEGKELLKLLRISEKENVLVDKLSGGMRRKVSLAIALIGSPQVIIIYELFIN